MYKAKKYDSASKTFTDVDSVILCHDYVKEDFTKMNDCLMHISNAIEADDAAIYQLTYDTTAQTPLSQPNSGLERFTYITQNAKGSLFRV